MCSAVSIVDQTSGKPEAGSNQVKKFYWKIRVTGKKYAELKTKTRARNKNMDPKIKTQSSEMNMHQKKNYASAEMKICINNSVIHGYRFWFVFHLISHFVFLKNGIKNKQRNNMKNDPKNSIFKKQLSCLFLMHFYFSFIFHPFFVFGFQVAEGCFGVVHSFSSFPIWQLHHSIHWSHYVMSKKIKIRHF